MSLNLLAVQDQITAKLRELTQDVYETAAPEDSKLKFDVAGNLKPYIVVQYSDMYPTSIGNGILGARYNAAEAYFLVTCIADSERAPRQISDLVKDKLVGFKPVDAGEIRFAGGAIDYANAESKPSRYIVDLGFLLQVNTVW